MADSDIAVVQSLVAERRKRDPFTDAYRPIVWSLLQGKAGRGDLEATVVRYSALGDSLAMSKQNAFDYVLVARPDAKPDGSIWFDGRLYTEADGLGEATLAGWMVGCDGGRVCERAVLNWKMCLVLTRCYADVQSLAQAVAPNLGNDAARWPQVRALRDRMQAALDAGRVEAFLRPANP